MSEYVVKIWHEHELRWQFIAEDQRGIYKSVRGPHLKDKQSKIHLKVVAWAKFANIDMDDIMYAVIPLDKYLDGLRSRGKMF